ncbi:hypothetical protein N8511_04160 [Akkermansiaceae bacterium]|nr:hypothetical protein [Akkermansiaceae bacterium]
MNPRSALEPKKGLQDPIEIFFILDPICPLVRKERKGMVVACAIWTSEGQRRTSGIRVQGSLPLEN